MFDEVSTRRLAEVALSRPFGQLHEADIWAWLIGAAPDLETASRLVKVALPSGAPLRLTSLVDAFGLDAVPLLTEVALGPHHAKDAVRALCIVGLPSVAEARA